MENRFFVEAKSFIFSVVEGLVIVDGGRGAAKSGLRGFC
jgi:hypothetical protein